MGTWNSLLNPSPFNVSTMLLLTDGTVMCHAVDSNGNGTPYWWKLTPGANGDYLSGTWRQLAAMQNLPGTSTPTAPLYYASALLRDGRVFFAGGEYNGTAPVDQVAAQVYDPIADVWQNIPTPAGWTNIGDAPCCVLPDGRVLLGNIIDPSTAIYDPVSNSWKAAANKDDRSSEETWTLLPDQTILSAECANHPRTEKYVIPADRWVDAGATPVDLVEASSIEIGPAILLPDGRVFAIGATGHTAIYSMSPIANQPGAWLAGPNFPSPASGQSLGAKDAPAALMPNGRVLCVAGPVDGTSGNYLGPTFFFEFDPITLTLNTVGQPSNAGGPPYVGRMLLLPTGQVLFANGSNNVQAYTPDGAPDAAWQPEVTSVPAALQPGQSYVLHGRQLNGVSQACSYGDDASMATNYPLVRIRNVATTKVTYCRTHDFSSMAVATGTVIHSTSFALPSAVDIGAAELTVVTNGIASRAQPVTIGAGLPSPIAWWAFDESAGTYTADSSGNNNSGTVVNGASFVPGHKGNALRLNGSNQYVSVNNTPLLNPHSSITVSAWVNASDWTGNRRILQKGDPTGPNSGDNQYQLLCTVNMLKFSIYNVGAVSAPVPPANTWHFVTATYDGNTLNLYIDGSPVASAAHAGLIPPSGGHLAIGTKQPGDPFAVDYFHGLLDDVRIYDRALSSMQVQMLYMS